MGSRVTVRKGIEQRLARSQGVRAEVRATAGRVLDAARARAAHHRDTGEYTESLHIERGSIDAHVVADADHAADLEYGHTLPNGRHVEGAHIMTGAATDVTR